MAITKESGRQETIIAKADFIYSDVTDNVYAGAVDVPIGAIVTGGGLAVTTIFNSATDDKFSIGHQNGDDSASGASLAALSADVTAATWIPIVPTGFQFTEPGTVGVVWNGSGTAPSAGAATLIVEYMIDGRAHFSEG